MENGKTEDLMEGVSEDQEETVEEPNLELTQLQGLVAELREEVHTALMELCELRHRDHSLEEKLRVHQTDVDEKILSLKNSLNTFKEELSAALFQIGDISSGQRDIYSRIQQQQLSENNNSAISAPNSRKNSRTSEDENIFSSSQSEFSNNRHFYSSLPQNGCPPQTSSTSTQTVEKEAEPQHCPSVSPTWGGRSSGEDTETFNSQPQSVNSQPEKSRRQTAALELLESERVYVSHLSLLLKANISFNGSEALLSKDKRPFPSSLRFLIQQHLELLHTLQERVLKCQWQGLMGDVFMRLTSKESDFLDFYVSYLKELPDCLSVVSMLASSSMKSSSLLERDFLGDDSKPSLHTLLLQPVQRIPDYLLLLQGLLRQTESDHPDYYLLLVCIQQFRSFTAQYHHLVQHNQELLLLHNRKEVKRSTMKQLLKTVETGIQTNISSTYPCSAALLDHGNEAKRSKQRLLGQMQSNRFKDWDQNSEPNCYDTEWPSRHQYFSSELDSHGQKPAGMDGILESEASDRTTSCQHHLPSRPVDFLQGQPGSALADALEEFFLPVGPPGMDSLYEEDEGSLREISMFDNCSTASSDSSIDIAFVKCPKGPATSHHAMEANVSSTSNIFSRHGNGCSKPPRRGCVSPDEAAMMRCTYNHPLQASQRKSKSLTGLQMENTVRGSDCSPLSDHLHRSALGSHAKLERQGSKGSKGCTTPSQKIHSPLRHRAEANIQSEDLHGPIRTDSGIQTWTDESRWRVGPEENSQSAFSERSRKQDKGGFRSSFKKLFKKKSSDEKKEKNGEKTPENHHKVNHEAEISGKNPKLTQRELNRGTAV